MWYRFSKLKWNYDIAVGIDYTYAYVKAVDQRRCLYIAFALSAKDFTLLRKKIG